MTDPHKQAPRELPHEPMPSSLRPVWNFLGYMVLIVIAMGIVAAIIALLVR